MKTIKVPTATRYNAKTCVGIGLVLIFISITLLYIPAIALSFMASFLIIIAFIMIRVGLNKSAQPPFALVLCHDHLQFHHRYGGWTLPWNAIKRIGIPSVGQGFDRQELCYIGIKIDNYSTLLNHLNPRLCAHLLTEQRSALYAALHKNCPDNTSPSDHLLEDDHYIDTRSGEYYHGLLAMFANRMDILQRLTGFDLLIDPNAISEDTQAFIAMSRRYQIAAQQTAWQHSLSSLS